MLKRVAPALMSGLFSLGSVLGADLTAAVFEGQDSLLRPEGYRQWIFVGSSMGLRYDENPEKRSSGESQRFNNVYLDPVAYREFSKTGKFPEGTVFVLEILSAASKKEPGLQGSYQKDRVALEASVKDSTRFEGGWAYFSFDDPSGKLKDKAQPRPQASCYACHHQKAATDHVFTQFYPPLRATAKN